MRKSRSVTHVDEWVNRPLGSFGQVVGGGTPSRSNLSFWSGPIPWASVKDFTDDDVLLDDTSEHISAEGLANSAATLVPEGTPVVCTRMAVGRCALTTRPTAINQDLKAFLLAKDINRKFFVRLLHFNGPILDRASVGTTVRGIPLRDLLSLNVLHPEAPSEQASIAASLDLVDATIRRLDIVIAKLKQVRSGLLHDLLTRGLDEHGQLRDPLVTPERFQDSPLGKIPRDWVFESLGERLQQNSGLIQTGPFGSQLHAHEYTAEGVPIIMPQDILDGAVDTSQVARIPTARADELKRHRIRLGDVIFARRGDLSRCAALAVREIGWLCGTGCLLMRFRESTLSPSWLSLAYRHDVGQRQVAARAVGTTMMNLNTKVLVHLRFAFPSKEEQVESVRRIAEADGAIRRESANRSKISHIKSGLMTDLLTGRVRVPADFKGNAAS